MKRCTVSMRSKDGLQSVTVDATSLFDAADKATDRWAQFWWYDPQADLLIEDGTQQWRVRQETVRAWRDKRLFPPRE